MGNNVVAVLYTDMMQEMQAPEAGKRLHDGVRSLLNGREPLMGYMGFGNAFSWDHSSGFQVCVVGKNSGWRVGYDNDIPPDVLNAVVQVLKDRGYRVSKPKKVVA